MKVTTMRPKAAGESGFALILAILALMLLTFLGMTLATTTSTELQISNNYRWGQQALYNAEAGLEAARALMTQIGDGQLVLPPARLAGWDPDSPAVQSNPAAGTPAPLFPAQRNFEGRQCDAWGYGAGYGQVLVDPNNPGAPFEYVHSLFGHDLNGNFTVWVRRDLVFNKGAGGAAGTLGDSPLGEKFIMTAEGSAPFGLGGGAAGDPQALYRTANRAIRRLESIVSVREGCRPSNAQSSQTGFSDCELL